MCVHLCVVVGRLSEVWLGLPMIWNRERKKDRKGGGEEVESSWICGLWFRVVVGAIDFLVNEPLPAASDLNKTVLGSHFQSMCCFLGDFTSTPISKYNEWWCLHRSWWWWWSRWNWSRWRWASTRATFALLQTTWFANYNARSAASGREIVGQDSCDGDQ